MNSIETAPTSCRRLRFDLGQLSTILRIGPRGVITAYRGQPPFADCENVTPEEIDTAIEVLTQLRQQLI